MLYCGVDLHKKFSYITTMDKEGKYKEQKKVINDELPHYFDSLSEDTKVAVEATSNWYNFYELIEDKVSSVDLAHPLKTRAIAEAKVKTDKVDSTILAHLLRTDLLPTSYIPPKEVRDTRELLRYRASLVRLRTQIKNKIHAILLKNGISHPFSDLFGKGGLKFLKELPLREAYKVPLEGYIQALENLSFLIKEISKHIDTLANKDDNVKLLMTIPGIGAYSAMLIMSEIGDIARFHSKKHLSSYAGLVPSTRSSANKIRHGHITTGGSKWLRWILIEAAQKAYLYKGPLYSFYQRIRYKKGYQKAVVALARKISIIIYYILKNKVTFQYFISNYRSSQPVDYMVSK